MKVCFSTQTTTTHVQHRSFCMIYIVQICFFCHCHICFGALLDWLQHQSCGGDMLILQKSTGCYQFCHSNPVNWHRYSNCSLSTVVEYLVIENLTNTKTKLTIYQFSITEVGLHPGKVTKVYRWATLRAKQPSMPPFTLTDSFELFVF